VLKYFTKYFVKSSQPQKRTLTDIFKTKDGQIAIILIFVTAIALIFYAVMLNVGAVANTKSIVTKTATLMAATASSQMASYSESIRQTYLGGRRRKCGWVSGIWYKWPWALMSATFDLMMDIMNYLPIAPKGVFAMVQKTVNKALRTVFNAWGWLTLARLGQYIDTTMNKKWNKEQRRTMTPEDQFLENVVRVGLANVISDMKKVIDYTDLDMDGAFYDSTTNTPKDYITRFQALYDLRIARIEPLSIEGLEAFIADMHDFVHVTAPDDWGLWDKISCQVGGGGHPCCGSLGERPAYCDPCCVGDDARNNRLCNIAHGFNWKNNCIAKSPYAHYNPFTYREANDNYTNNSGATPRLSFREQLGKDDEHAAFRYDFDATQTDSQLYMGGPSFPNTPNIFDSFRIEDATGVFPFFHKMRDWGIDLGYAEMVRGTIPPFEDKLECHWTDARYPSEGGVVCATPPRTFLLPDSRVYDLSQLLLPVPPTVPIDCNLHALNRTLPPGSCTLDPKHRTAYVDGRNPWFLATDPPVKTDEIGIDVGPPPPPPQLVAPDDECSDAVDQTWKKGADLYCSIDEAQPPPNGGFVNATGWPYFSECPKHASATCDVSDPYDPDPPTWGQVDCPCGPLTNRSLWADDSIDDFIYGVDEFVSWADVIINTSPEELKRTFVLWYPAAARWIEKRGELYMTNEDGMLWQWLWNMENWNSQINYWLTNDYEAANWSEAWCYPPLPPSTDAPPFGMPTGEEAAIQAELTNGDDTFSLDAAVACLDWNVNDPLPAPWPATLTPLMSGHIGNASKFEACIRACEEDPSIAPTFCQDLPRSLIPGFDYKSFTTQDPTALADFQRCKDHDTSSHPVLSCAYNYTDCSVLPTTYPAYGLPAFTPPSVAVTQLQRIERCGKDTCLPNGPNAAGSCNSCYGQAGTTCAGTLDCTSLFFEKSLVEQAVCYYDGYGSCCEWDHIDGRFYNWEPGNEYYDAIASVRNSPESCLNWGENNGSDFYNNLQQAVGTCAYKSTFANSRYTALLDQLLVHPEIIANPTAHLLVRGCKDACVLWIPPGLTQRCELCDITCGVLPDWTDSLGNTFPMATLYNKGPLDPNIDADLGQMLNIYTCMTGCGQANCGSFPGTYSGGFGTHTFIPFQNNSILDPAHIPLFDACLNSAKYSDKCAGNCCANNCSTLPQAKIVAGVTTTYGLPAFTPVDSVALNYKPLCTACEGQVGGLCNPGASYAQLACDDLRLMHSEVDGLIAFYSGSCSDLVNLPSDIRFYDWGTNLTGGNTFYNALLAAMAIANQGSCQDPAFVLNVEKSFYAAWNQVAKFSKRLKILEGNPGTSPSPLRQEGIVDEAKNLRGYLQDAIQEFKDFLAAAQSLIEARRNLDSQVALSQQAIYGWKSETDIEGEGLWHVVRVDARLPKRCNDLCSPDQSSSQRWPWIRAYTRSHGLKRCYVIEDHTGVVKAKATRYDQPREGSGKVLKFPGGLPIWQFRRTHPFAMFSGTQEADIRDMETACSPFFDPLTRLDWGEAFLIDKKNGNVQSKGAAPERTVPLPADQCWSAANKVLRRGVTEEVCSQYYLGKFSGHYSQLMRFVNCANFR